MPKYFVLGLDAEGGGTSPIANLIAPTALHIRAVQFAVVSVGEADGAIACQVGTSPSYVAPAAQQSVQAPGQMFASIVLGHMVTTSGISNAFVNVTVPVDARLEPGQSLNVFCGTQFSGSGCSLYGFITVICD